MPTILPSPLPSQFPTETCVDDFNFNISLDNGNLQDCRWLTMNKLKTQSRIKKYCARREIQKACKQTCYNCICEDDLVYRFLLDNGSEQDCSWFLRNNDRTDTRRKNYCDRTLEGRLVSEACRLGCGLCTYPNPILDPRSATVPTEDLDAAAERSVRRKKHSIFNNFL